MSRVTRLELRPDQRHRDVV